MVADAPAAAGAVVEVEVRALASSGSGVAELPEGRVVFVPRGAPGDLARVRVRRSKARWAEASLVEVVRGGPHRVVPPCSLYERCGGCALQHVDYATQLEWKGRFVSDALERIGGVSVEPPVVEPSPGRLRYRNRVSFTLRRLRGGRVVAGFHALERPGHVVDIGAECLLPEPPLLEAWVRLRAAWGPGARRLPEGGRLRIGLRSTHEGVALLVQGGAPGWAGGGLTELVPGLVSVWHRPAGAGTEERVEGKEVTGSWGEEALPVHGSAFVQVNPGAAALLSRHVLDVAGTGERAVDAYAGVGVYARALARLGWRVSAIEADAAACAAARSDAPPGLQVREGAVEALLPAELPAELVVLNPPRTGLHEAVPDQLVAQPPARVIYVSCDPGTLARDCARLRPAFAIRDVHAFDLFPQTAHVETVVVLERSSTRWAPD